MNDCASEIRPALTEAFSNGLHIVPAGDDCKVTFPIDRSDGDSISVWVIDRGDDTFEITDEGETYGMLYLSNVDLDQTRRENRVETLQERYSLDSAKEEISVVADRENLGRRLLDVLEAVQGVSYLSYTRKQYTQTDFRGDVGSALTEMGFNYNANPEVDGASEKHRMDFSVLQQSQPTYIESFHSENASSAKRMARNTAYKMNDIRIKTPDVRMVSVVDDESGEYGADAESILENYSDALVPWSQRDRLQGAIVG